MNYQNQEVNQLMEQIAKYEADIQKIEQATNSNLEKTDKYEKRATQLSLANGELSRKLENLNTNERAAMSQALTLIVEQSETLEKQLEEQKRKNAALEHEIIDLDAQQRGRLQDLETAQQSEANNLRSQQQKQQQLQDQYERLQNEIFELKKNIDDQNSVNQQLQQNMEQLQDLAQVRGQTVRRPQIGSENILESLYQDLKEYSNDLIKLLVLSQENPQKFLERGGKTQYLDILGRIERKKAQILFVENK